VGKHEYFIDENLLPIGKALSEIRSDCFFPGHASIPEIGRGAKDEEWLEVVGKLRRNLVVITQDKRITQKPAELLLVKAHDVRIVVLTAKKDTPMWEKFGLLVRSWDKVEKYVTKAGLGPWACQLKESGVSDIVLPK
jgi:hypothetical protein